MIWSHKTGLMHNRNVMSHGGKVSTSYNTLGRNSLELISDAPEEHLGIFSGTLIIQVTNKSEGSHRQERLDWL